MFFLVVLLFSLIFVFNIFAPSAVLPSFRCCADRYRDLVLHARACPLPLLRWPFCTVSGLCAPRGWLSALAKPGYCLEDMSSLWAVLWHLSTVVFLHPVLRPLEAESGVGCCALKEPIRGGRTKTMRRRRGSPCSLALLVGCYCTKPRCGSRTGRCSGAVRPLHSLPGSA